MVEQVRRLDGKVIIAEIAAAPVTYEGKSATLVMLTDVTERKHLEDALLSTNAQLMGILNAARRLSIIATDTTGSITTFNAGAEALLGYSAEEMIGKRSPNILHIPAEIERRGHDLSVPHGLPVRGFDVLVHNARQGGFDEHEWTYVRKDGTHFTALVTVTALRNEENVILGYLTVGQDITQRKNAEAALLLTAQELEAKNSELAKARDQALQAVQLKTDFLATMSHEIRTPMNAIIGMTGLLLDTDLTEEQHEYADTVRRSSDALLTLVNDILDFSKIEAGKLQFENLAFDLRTTVEDTLELLAEQAQSKGLELIGLVDAEVPIGVLGDPGRVRQILVNLIGNAIKFTHMGEVFLHVTCEGEERTGCTAIHDYGYRDRHSRRRAGATVPSIYPGRQFNHSSIWRHRPRARHLPTPRETDAGPDRNREPAGPGQHLLVYRRSAGGGARPVAYHDFPDTASWAPHVAGQSQ